MMYRPEKIEYNPYFQHYIDLVEVGGFYNLFDYNTQFTVHFFSTVPKDKHNYKYAENKWTVKEV